MTNFLRKANALCEVRAPYTLGETENIFEDGGLAGDLAATGGASLLNHLGEAQRADHVTLREENLRLGRKIKVTWSHCSRRMGGLTRSRQTGHSTLILERQGEETDLLSREPLLVSGV